MKLSLNLRESVYTFLEQESRLQDISVAEVVADALGHYIFYREVKNKKPNASLLIDDGSGKLIYLEKREVL